MAFHFLSFKIATLIIRCFHIDNITVLSDLVPGTSNVIGFMLYMILGVTIPICIGKMIETIKNRLQHKVVEG